MEPFFLAKLLFQLSAAVSAPGHPDQIRTCRARTGSTASSRQPPGQRGASAPKAFSGIFNNEIHFYENYLTQGNDYIRLLSFKDLPDWLVPFETGSYPDFVLCIRKYPTLIAKNRVNTKRKLHFQGLFKSMRDLDSEKAYGQAEQILEQVISEGAGLFSVETYLLLRAKTKEALDSLTVSWIGHYKAKNASLRIEEQGLSFLYQSLIPGVPASFKRSLDIPSDFLGHMIPIHRNYIHEEGLVLDCRDGVAVAVDIFHHSSLSYNALITGTTGQGKSMLANKLLLDQLGKGSKALVLDLGNSFRKNAQFHNGTILSQKINPLQFKNPAYIKEFILSAVDDKLGRKNEGKLFEEVKKAMLEEPNRTFSSLLNFLSAEFPGIEFYFSEIMEFFTEEVVSVNEFTYCDFGNYPEAMKAPLIIYLIEYFKNLEGRKIFVFDECWHLLENNALYIEECFRTFRKHNASAIAISQTLSDFADTKVGRVIINTSYTKFLFKQDVASSEFLDPLAKSLLDSVQSRKGEYSEFLYKSEVGLKPLRYVPTKLEYELFTTNANDMRSFDAYMAEKGKFLDFQRAIQNYTSIKYESEAFQ